ncbi:MAG: tetraacyldisaccharide 4'-kinase [Anaerolineae bacterium]|nr:tetraacyldisaccharide 4'-kinase [Phycisphaerae bacterium]
MEDFYRRVMNGTERGVAAMSLRALTSAIEPIYRAVVTTRNRRFDRGTSVQRVDRPVISVGNITTGGTGKTPVVRWLADSLRSRSIQPAILMRGYKSQPGKPSDEQALLLGQLDNVIVHANPDRVAGARDVLRDHPDVQAFILDDGFQHRRLHRDFDLVLIDATNPFGYGRVLPRGLLREPLAGLARANAILITRTDQASSSIAHLEDQLRTLAPGKPIFRSSHQQIGTESLQGKRIIALSGIGNPDAFEQQLASAGATIVASKRFGDHHCYTASDLANLPEADAIVTTEKDWVKIAKIDLSDTSTPILRVQVRIRFESDHERQLLDYVSRVAAAAR